MTQKERELSNLSYTNKDFGQIYPELLDLATKISYKWDPASSDESDPGVVLLKLAALMADKNNYNIDKNILELFPLSVTQEANAREIFDQCGYVMRYYNSATTNVNINIIEEPKIEDTDWSSFGDVSGYTRMYQLPMFTMLTDANNETVYTTTRDVSIPSTGEQVGVDVIEGKIVDLDIDGEVQITRANLDYNNRIYFPVMDIAENGIFISNNNQSWSDWKRVDNLTIQAIGTYCYKFGLSHNGTSCYIEFPDDIDSLIGEGIYIKYIRTSGVDGNVGSRRISQLYTDTTGSKYLLGVTASTIDCKITNDNLHISNALPATNGKNPETIDSAYRNYQKVKTTFDTLVSLKDYTDFLYTNKLYSNGYVCDRTNDPQCSYDIVEGSDSYAKTHTIVELDGSSPKMTAFDLKIYGLTYVDSPAGNLTKNVDTTFDVITWDKSVVSDYAILDQKLHDVKSIQHNLIVPEVNVPFMYKNKFDIKCTLMPQYSLTDSQKQEVVYAIKYALADVLNSRAIDFGNEADFDVIYDTILNADPRIKSVSLDTPKYETYAVYPTGAASCAELRIDDQSTEPLDTELKDLWNSFRDNIVSKSVLAGRTPLFASKNAFDLPVFQTTPKSLTAEYVRTEARIPIDNIDSQGQGEYKIKENENIILTSKNLITDQTYGSYVKYIQQLTKPAVRDSNYTLGTNEFIIFFWKKEDGDDVPYSYYKYSENSNVKIISPSFTLETHQEDGTAQTNGTLAALRNYCKGLKDGSDKIESDATITVTYTEGKDNKTVTLNVMDCIASLSGSGYSLTGTRQIVTKKTNAVKLSDTTAPVSMFWILNHTSVNNKAVLFKENETTYTLQTGEYLFYTNASKTQLVSLGAGTIITRSGNNAQLSCEAITYDDLLTNGFLSYLNGETDGNERWIKIGYIVTATEQQYYQLGQKTILRLKNPAFADKKIEIRNDGMYVFDDTSSQWKIIDDTTGFTFSFIDSESTTTDETVLSTTTDTDLQWNVASMLNLDISPNNSMTLERYQTITLLYNEYLSITCSKNGTTSTDKATRVSQVDKNPSIIGEWKRASVNKRIDIKDGNTLLYGGVKCTYTTLEEGKVSFSYDGYEFILTLVQKKPPVDLSGTIYTNKPLSSVGGENVDVRWYDITTLSYKPLEFYCYGTATNTEDDWVWSNTQANITLTKQESEESINFESKNTYTLLPGNYIVPVIIKTESATSIKIGLKTEAGKIYYLRPDSKSARTDNDNVSFTSAGSYYCRVIINGESLNYKLVIVSNDAATIIFNPLHEYNTEGTIFNDTSYLDRIYNKTQQLDKNHYFNYTYEVPEEQLIENPLDATSFFKSTHIYNKNTIAQWRSQSDESRFTILNKIR